LGRHAWEPRRMKAIDWVAIAIYAYWLASVGALLWLAAQDEMSV